MRFTFKGAFTGCCLGVILTVAFLWNQCTQSWKNRNNSTKNVITKYLTNFPEQNRVRHPLMSRKNGDEQLSDEINCIINGEFSIVCKRDESEIYIPFSFIHDYFEIYGRLSLSKDGEEVFEWSHSYSNIFVPLKQYDSFDSFLNFHLFNVEARERVKCISASEGIPISTQWKSTGYPYPIQIAQYGLSHYSKYLEQSKVKRIYLDGAKNWLSLWKWDSHTSSLVKAFSSDIRGYVLHFNTNEEEDKTGRIIATIPKSWPQENLVVNMFLKLESAINSSLIIKVKSNDKKSDNFMLHYALSDQLLTVEGQHIYYGLGKQWKRRYFTRNVLLDLLKGISASSSAKKLRKRVNKNKVRIVSIELCGRGHVSNVSLSTKENLRHFYDAADWFVEHQDEKGGWPIPVPRKVVPRVLELAPGWYSAMAQGQAISVLVRAGHISNDEKYLNAANRALKLFSIDAKDGGVRTHFPGNHVWYEEYPTTPSLFVLNGFVYSLLGLYDLMRFSSTNKEAKNLFDEGLSSLNKLLPLFDSGHGSFYDLRHFTAHVGPNLARWDYHTTHVTQLLALGTVSQEYGLFFNETADRWKGYLVGKRAKHN